MLHQLTVLIVLFIELNCSHPGPALSLTWPANFCFRHLLPPEPQSPGQRHANLYEEMGRQRRSGPELCPAAWTAFILLLSTCVDCHLSAGESPPSLYPFIVSRLIGRSFPFAVAVSLNDGPNRGCIREHSTLENVHY